MKLWSSVWAWNADGGNVRVDGAGQQSEKPDPSDTIAIVGKYVALHDAYMSVVEALRHAGFDRDTEIDIKWVNSEDVSDDNVHVLLGDVDGILVPGGFGDRGIEGKISAIRYAREQRIPFLGICLGMQMVCVEGARNVLELEGAHSCGI